MAEIALDMQKLRVLFENRWHSVQLDKVAQWGKVLSLWVRYAASEILFLARATYRLARIKRLMTRQYRATKDGLRIGILSCDKVLHSATACAELADNLFLLAERDQQMIARLREGRPKWFFSFTLWVSRKMNSTHESLACFAEDAAETLALSASRPFAALVQQELDERS